MGPSRCTHELTHVALERVLIAWLLLFHVRSQGLLSLHRGSGFETPSWHQKDSLVQHRPVKRSNLQADHEYTSAPHVVRRGVANCWRVLSN